MSAAAAPIVEARDLYKTYAGGGDGVPALRGVSMTVAPAEMIAITGPSGCGKSTLLHLLGGLDVPTSGVHDVAGRGSGIGPEFGVAPAPLPVAAAGVAIVVLAAAVGAIVARRAARGQVTEVLRAE